MSRISNRKEHGFSTTDSGTGTGPQFEENSYDVPSKAAPMPVDREGIKFRTKNDLIPYFGRTESNVKRVAWDQATPQYVRDRGRGRPENASVYQSLGEITKYLHGEAGLHLPEEQRTPTHKRMEGRYNMANEHYQAELSNVNERRKAGEHIHTYEDQEHLSNKGMHASTTHYPHGRIEDSATSSQGSPSFTSDRNKVEAAAFPTYKTQSRNQGRS